MTNNQTIFPYLSTAERDRRWKQTYTFMEQHNLQAIIAVGSYDTNKLQPYLANADGGVLVFPLDSAPIHLGGLWSVGLNFDNARNGIKPWVEDTRVCPDPIAAAGEVLKQLGLTKSRIGVFGLTAAMIPIGGTSSYPSGIQMMEVLKEAEIVDVTIEYGLLMLKKSKEELAMVRHAAKANEHACEALFHECRIGAREADIYAAVNAALTRDGCDPTPFTINMTIGAESMSFLSGLPWLYPQGEPRTLKEGDIVEAELFAWYGGLDSQAQISVHIGEPDEERLRLAETASRAYQTGVAMIRPGVPFVSVWKEMKKVIRNENYWVASPLLHSLSPVLLAGELNAGMMEADIDPSLKSPACIVGYHDEELLLEEGMVLAVEPCAADGYKKSMSGGAVIVTEDGAEELNSFPLQMRIAR